jgi:hypothetical protein
MAPEFMPPPPDAVGVITTDRLLVQIRVEDDADGQTAGEVSVTSYVDGSRIGSFPALDTPDLRRVFHGVVLHAHVLLTAEIAFPGVVASIWALLDLAAGPTAQPHHPGEEDTGASAWRTSCPPLPCEARSLTFEDADPDNLDYGLPPGPHAALLLGRHERLESLRAFPADLAHEAADFLQQILRGAAPRSADQLLAVLSTDPLYRSNL